MEQKGRVDLSKPIEDILTDMHWLNDVRKQAISVYNKTYEATQGEHIERHSYAVWQTLNWIAERYEDEG